jgi:hypothetical protein
MVWYGGGQTSDALRGVEKEQLKAIAGVEKLSRKYFCD